MHSHCPYQLNPLALDSDQVLLERQQAWQFSAAAPEAVVAVVAKRPTVPVAQAQPAAPTASALLVPAAAALAVPAAAALVVPAAVLAAAAAVLAANTVDAVADVILPNVLLGTDNLCGCSGSREQLVGSSDCLG